MPLEFKLVREITVSGFAADANPNTTAPADSLVFHMTQRASGQSSDTAARGHSVYFRFLDGSNVEVTGGTVDFQTWAKDLGASSSGTPRWTSLLAETAAPSSQIYSAALEGDLFMQVTALGSVGAATKVQVWATERSSVGAS